jgi:hypothetical protein
MKGTAMRHLIAVVAIALVTVPSITAAQTPAAPQTAAPSAPTLTGEGRYQLVVVSGHPGSPFLLDTSTGCIWHIIRNEETKRSTFIEVDVENLHWSWGSGAQQTLAARIDGSNLTDEQKRLLKQDLARTGCGLSNVVLTPTPGTRPATPGTGQQPPAGPQPAPPASGQPRPRPSPK